MSGNMSYIGRKACGCAVAAVVDDPRWAKQTAKDVAAFIKSGLTVERVTRDVVVSELTRDCPHQPKQGRLIK